MKNQTIYIIIGVIVLIILYFVMRKKITGIVTPFKLRGKDIFGSGGFKSSRSKHKGVKYHQGLDIKTNVDQPILAPFDIIFKRLAYPYLTSAGIVDKKFKGALYKYKDGTLKIFYMNPIANKSNFKHGEIIGFAQNISGKYSTTKKKMINHIHLEMRDNEGKLLNPTNYV